LDKKIELVWTEKLSEDLSQQIECKLCGQSMELLRVNDQIAFWVHRGKQLEICQKIGFRTSFGGILANMWRMKRDKLQKQILEAKHNDSSSP